MLNRMTLAGLALLLSSLVAAGCGGTSVPDSPDGMILTVAEELANNNPAVLWDAMPAGYQSDIETIIHDAAATMDAEVYDKVFVIANKVVDVLKEKRDFILGLPLLKEGFVAMMITDQEELKNNWNEIVDVVEILTTSDLSTLDSLMSLDVGDFLGGTGGDLMAQFEKLSTLYADPSMAGTWDKFKSVEVDVKSTEGDKAVVEIKVEGENPETMELVKVEGKWVPADIARGWEQDMADMKAQIAQMTSTMTPAEKTNALAKLAGVEQIIDQLAKAEMQEDFTQIVMSLMGGM